MTRRLWRTVLGRAVCAVLTDGHHHWAGPAPFARCSRCGQVSW